MAVDRRFALVADQHSEVNMCKVVCLVQAQSEEASQQGCHIIWRPYLRKGMGLRCLRSRQAQAVRGLGGCPLRAEHRRCTVCAAADCINRIIHKVTRSKVPVQVHGDTSDIRS